MSLTTKQIKILRDSFPKESIQAKKGFKDSETGEQKYLTGVKPQYVIERCNDAFGHDGWDFSIIHHGIEGKQVWVHGKMSIFAVSEDKANMDGPIIRKIISSKEQFGTGSYNAGTPIGDALKGASTNAFEKCASMYDIAHEAYKGLIPIPSDNDMSKDQKRDGVIKELLKTCKQYSVGKDVFPKFVSNVLKESKTPTECTIEELQQLIDHLNTHKTPF